MESMCTSHLHCQVLYGDIYSAFRFKSVGKRESTFPVTLVYIPGVFLNEQLEFSSLVTEIKGI